jgi:hypothetical protein
VVTSCTARKRGLDQAVTLLGSQGFGSVHTLAAAWLAQVRAAHAAYTPTTLYGGRSFTEAVKAAAHGRAALHVVSAGLGLVAGAASVPCYDATIASKDAELAAALQRIGASTSAWWLALNDGPALARLVNQAPGALVMLALPSSYVEMLADDLTEVSNANVKRLRIFTSELGVQALPPHLRDAWLPYDDRLEAVPGWNGTRSDFPQRALGHFVRKLNGMPLALADAKAAVADALRPLKVPARPTGVRLNDDALRAWLHANWDDCKGHTGRLLAKLRHDAGLACEQSRFAQLCREVRSASKEVWHVPA